MRLGFIGTGKIVEAMVTGLCGTASEAPSIVLSPRNANVAASLATTFPAVSVAASNQDVLDGSDVVVIAVRPQIVREVLAELRFETRHHVISVVSLLSLEELRQQVTPACTVVRAVPLPSAAKRRSPTVVYPDDSVARELFSRMGTEFAAGTEAEFEALCTVSATMASQFAFEEAIASWLLRQGVSAEKARGLVGEMFFGLAHTTVEQPEREFRALAMDHATRGGLNEQMERHLRDCGVFEAVTKGLDAVLERYRANAGKYTAEPS
jgi:pyrroline-5-carboxylate reductase